jgi:hypothetical protein
MNKENFVTKNAISVDVEADGPAPGLFSIVSFGAVVIDGEHTKTFYGKVKPISPNWNPSALAISGHTRAEHETFDDPTDVMTNFALWLREHCDGRPRFFCDNPGFDFGFINYYFHRFYGSNPFGWSAFDTARFYKGLRQDLRVTAKKLKTTKHTHHPVDDAKGNAEAVVAMSKLYNIKGLKF